VFRKFTP